MAIFKQDMVEILMNAGCLHRLDSPSLFVTCNGGELGLMWKDAEATIEQFYDFSIYLTPMSCMIPIIKGKHAFS